MVFRKISLHVSLRIPRRLTWAEIFRYVPGSVKKGGGHYQFAKSIDTCQPAQSFSTLCTARSSHSINENYPGQPNQMTLGLSGVKNLRNLDPDSRFFNRVISVVSSLLRETTLTISFSTGEPVSMKAEILKK